MTTFRPLTILPALALALAGACRGKAPEADAPAPHEPVIAVAVPVRIAPVERRNLSEEVAASGHTTALAQEKIRAPYAGTLSELSVTDGDRVRRGQEIGAVVSRDTEAALAGARDMQRQARTDAEKTDAARALALAERGLVRGSILAPTDGTVLSHAAVRGDRISEDQEVLTIADPASVAFLADVPQSELGRIRRGQAAWVEIAGRPARLAGTVHDVLPGANAADFTAPVRIDLKGVEGVPPLGLFGTARIVVAERRDAAVVPEAALLRDDVTGVTRLALVEKGRARWLDVTTGLRTDGRVEIKSPALEAGRSVVVSGQIGLADGAPVAAAP